MGILDNLFATRETLAPEKRSSYYYNSFGNPTDSGETVTGYKAMTTSAVYACVRIIAETVASLPLHVYERQDRGKRRATDFPLYSILHDSPNELMTSFEFRELMQANLLLWGNALAEVDYNGRGGINQLWPLKPDMVHEVKTQGGRIFYKYQRPDNSIEWISSNTVWHIKGLGADGLWGYSPITMMRNAIGISLASEKTAGSLYKNGIQLNGILKTPGVLSEDAYGRIADSWATRYGGTSNAHKTAILEEGLEYQQLSMSPEDSQFLETRKFQITEIARAFRVPPHMLADLDRATFSNIEQQSIDFVTNTIRPWLVRWEQSIQKNLILSRYQNRYFSEFLVDGLLRGDAKTRHETYSIGRQNGYYSANDIREMENKNPIPDGDVYLVPLNMVPAGDVGQSMPQEAQRAANPQENAETRARTTAAGRLRLVSDFIPVFESTFARLVRREVADVKRQAKKTLGKDDLAGFLLWIESFYEDHRGFMDRELTPIFAAYASAIIRAVGRELDNDSEADLTSFTSAYLETYTTRYGAKQIKYLIAAIERAQADGIDLLETVNGQMDTWDEERPTQEANRESRRANNAIAMAAYAQFGVTVKRWVTISDSCPYCNKLNGKVVEVDSYFMSKGDAITVEGQSALPISVNLGHPPAHDGCDCMVVAG